MTNIEETGLEDLQKSLGRSTLSLITEEKLKSEENRKFVDNAFRDGVLKTTGTDIDRLMPPVSRFGGSGSRDKKKQTIIEKLKAFFEKYFGIVDSGEYLVK